MIRSKRSQGITGLLAIATLIAAVCSKNLTLVVLASMVMVVWWVDQATDRILERLELSTSVILTAIKSTDK